MRRLALIWLAMLWGGLQSGVWAQDFRDPTVAPADAVGTAGFSAGDPAANSQGSSVVVRDGKPHLVVGTRLVAVGQKVGNARLERITETEIWLREGRALRKVPRFGGIQRRVAASTSPCLKPPLHGKRQSKLKPPTKAVTPAAPCEGAQP